MTPEIPATAPRWVWMDVHGGDQFAWTLVVPKRGSPWLWTTPQFPLASEVYAASFAWCPQAPITAPPAPPAASIPIEG